MKLRQTFLVALALALNVSAYGQSVNLDSGLVAHYPFSGNANDQSGNANNGLVFGATLTSDKSGNPNGAYRFNGTTDYIQVPNSPTLQPQALTMCALVKPEGFYQGACGGNVIAWKGREYSVGNYGILFSDALFDSDCNYLDSLHETFYGVKGTDQNPTPFSTNSPYFIQKNTWYCVVYTLDANKAAMYVNGEQTYELDISSPIGANSQPLLIGSNRPFNTQYPYPFKGVIDELRLYNRVLNKSEIACFCSEISNKDILGQNVEVCEVESYTIRPNIMFQTGDVFKWSDGSSDSTLVVKKDGVYSLTYLPQLGCQIVDSVKVSFTSFSEFKFPTAFTPDGDGVNDIFSPTGKLLPTFTDISIYNRWGELVFQGNSSKQNWDGTVGGKPAPADVYIYKATYIKICPNSTDEKKSTISGDVTLIR